MRGEKAWAQMSPEERREERFKRWLSPKDVTFKDDKAERRYKERVKRFIDVIKLQKPDRVPVMLPIGFFPPYNAGFTLKDVMYDYEILKKAWLKLIDDFDMDTFPGPGLVYPGKVLELMEYRLHRWPGHGLEHTVSSYQYIEGEYMTADEYDAFIRDPAHFILATYLPRIAGIFSGFRKFGSMIQGVGSPVAFIEQFSDPELRASIERVLEASLEVAKWRKVVEEVNRAALEAGIPSLRGAMSNAPFDRIGDFLRGTKGVMLDMYRCPEKLIEAMERVTPMIIGHTLKVAELSDSPIIFIPLHKGPAGFMSNRQFEKFYWPTLRKVMLAFIEEGFVPMPFAEGDYEPRLEIIKDMPRASVIWYFEVMDMEEAKKVLGDNACIAGNLPVSMLYASTPKEIKEACKRLIETCGQNGGYILAASASIDRGNPENIRAMMEAAAEYGVY